MLVPGYFSGIVAAQKERHLTLRESAHLAEGSQIVIELWCGHYVKVDVEAGVTADHRLQRHINTRKTGKFAGCGKHKKSRSLERRLGVKVRRIVMPLLVQLVKDCTLCQCAAPNKLRKGPPALCEGAMPSGR